MGFLQYLSDSHLRNQSFSPEDAQNLIQLFLEACRKLVNADESSILVYDRVARSLIFRELVGSAESRKCLLGQGVPYGQGTVGVAFVAREPTSGTTVYTELSQARGHPEHVMAVPFFWENECVGIVTAIAYQTNRPEPFTPKELQTLAKVVFLLEHLLSSLIGIDVLKDCQTGESGQGVSVRDMPQVLSSICSSDNERKGIKILKNVARIVDEKPELLDNCLALTELMKQMTGIWD